MSQRKGKRSGKIKIAAVLVILFLGIPISVFIVKRSLRVEQITVEGLTYYSEEEFIGKVLSESAQKNIWALHRESRENRKKTIPYVEKYDITVKKGRQVYIRVYEKILVGCVKIMGQYMYFDKDGLVSETAAERLPGIPLIKGLEFDRIVLYEKLQIKKEELYKKILNITKLVKEYEIEADSITFNKRGEAELETGTLTVELGKRDSYDLPIQKLADILPSISDRNLMIDLSGFNGEEGDIMAKPKTK